MDIISLTIVILASLTGLALGLALAGRSSRIGRH